MGLFRRRVNVEEVVKGWSFRDARRRWEKHLKAHTPANGCGYYRCETNRRLRWGFWKAVGSPRLLSKIEAEKKAA